MKNALKLLFISALLIAGPLVNAQTLKFGHINSSRLLSIMPEREAAQKQMQREAQSLQEHLEKMQVEYNNKLQDYMEEQDELSTAVRQLKERELRELQTRIQEFQATAQEDLQQIEMELIQPIFEKIENAIAAVARERGYIYVFDIDGNSILYFSDESEDVLPYVRTELGL